jgi:hypothetical protein
MVKILIPIICALLYRFGGWGDGDRFLYWWKHPILPKNKVVQFIIKRGRDVGIGLIISLVTGNWWHLPAYYIAVRGFPYGENNWLSIFGQARWFISGVMFGIASFNWGNAIWCGVCMYSLMYLSNIGISKGFWWKKEDYWVLDHSILEMLFGCLATLFFVL